MKTFQTSYAQRGPQKGGIRTEAWSQQGLDPPLTSWVVGEVTESF